MTAEGAVVDFARSIAAAHAVDGLAVDLGRGVHDGALAPQAVVNVPMDMMKRHGLVAGATGAGKTKTLQGIAGRPARARPSAKR